MESPLRAVRRCRDRPALHGFRSQGFGEGHRIAQKHYQEHYQERLRPGDAAQVPPHVQHPPGRPAPECASVQARSADSKCAALYSPCRSCPLTLSAHAPADVNHRALPHDVRLFFPAVDDAQPQSSGRPRISSQTSVRRVNALAPPPPTLSSPFRPLVCSCSCLGQSRFGASCDNVLVDALAGRRREVQPAGTS